MKFRWNYLVLIYLLFGTLIAQEKKFNDIVIMKNGKVVTGVKATEVSDSIVITSEDGETNIYKKFEVTEVKTPSSNKMLDETKKEGKLNSLNWSSNQGFTNWRTANRKCTQLNMRLPTIKELQFAFSNGITDSWKQSGNSYWSATVEGDSTAFNFDIYHGNTYADSKRFSFFVRCVQ